MLRYENRSKIHNLFGFYSFLPFFDVLPLTVYPTVPANTRNAPLQSILHVTSEPSNNTTLSTKETALRTTRTSVTVSAGTRVVRRLTPAVQRSCVNVLARSTGSTAGSVNRAAIRGTDNVVTRACEANSALACTERSWRMEKNKGKERKCR